MRFTPWRIAGALVLIVAIGLALTLCSRPPPPTADMEFGAAPKLRAPETGVLPVVNAAKAVGWPEGAAPTAPEGFKVEAFAAGLSHPRWLYVLPNGDVLVAQASTRASTGEGVVGWITNSVMRRAGALNGDAENIVLLRDENGDGVSDIRAVFARELNQPFGMALIGDTFYFANTDAVLKCRYADGALRLSDPIEHVMPLPYRSGDNGHWTRNLLASPDGKSLFVSVGSASNIADYGMKDEVGRAAIWQLDVATGASRIYASGLRNPVGMDFEPSTGKLFAVANERDMLGDALVPDYLTHVQDGAFYGWPFSYYGNHVDTRVHPQDAEKVASAIAPDFALGAHVAALGLHFYRGDALGDHYVGGAFIGEHGSWNRRDLTGYKVVYVPFENGAPKGEIEDFLTGFLNDKGEAQGRPVGVVEAKDGALLVADDVGGVIWRVSRAN